MFNKRTAIEYRDRMWERWFCFNSKTDTFINLPPKQKNTSYPCVIPKSRKRGKSLDQSQKTYFSI